MPGFPGRLFLPHHGDSIFAECVFYPRSSHARPLGSPAAEVPGPRRVGAEKLGSLWFCFRALKSGP